MPKSPSMKVLSDNIRSARLAANMTQDDAARTAGMQGAVYGRIERAEVDPRLSSLHKIAKSLGASILDIVDGTDGKPQDPALGRGCIVVDARTGAHISTERTLLAPGDLLMPTSGTCWRVVHREFIESRWYVVVRAVARTEFIAARNAYDAT